MSAALLMVGAELVGIWQMVRNILVLSLNMPVTAFGGFSLLIAVALGTEPFYSGSVGFFKISLGVIGAILIATLLYKLVCYLYSLVEMVLVIVLEVLNCEKRLDALLGKAEEAVRKYLSAFDSDAPEWAGHWIFGVPFAIHWVNRVAGKICNVFQFMIYPLSAGAGLYVVYWMGNWEEGFSSLKTIDYILLGVFVAVVVGVFVRLGHELVVAIRDARHSAGAVDDLFAAYSEFFKRKRPRAGKYRTDKQEQYEDTYEDAGAKSDANEEARPQDDNPYIHILSKATSAAELQKLYRNGMKMLHPDVCKDYSVEESTRRSAQLNAAYEYCKKRFGS